MQSLRREPGIAEAERHVMMEEAQAEQARNEWHSLGEGAAFGTDLA